MTDTALSREIPMDQLVLPEDDVRSGRNPDGIQSIAASMGDPSVGQQQPITVYPNDFPNAVDEGDEDELDGLFTDEHPLVIHDGVTRYRAAEMLGWETLWAVIVPEPPENEVVARLEANTERIEMSDYEVFSALRDYYEESDATLEDVGEKAGMSKSYVSQVFSMMDGPEWLVQAWQHPEHPLETGQALDTMRLLSESTIENYAEAGNLAAEEARQRAVEDARLMIDVQQKHNLTVSEYRSRVQRKRKESIDDLRDSRSMEGKRAEGQAKSAQQEHTPRDPPDPDPCTCCGSDRPNDRRFAVAVCGECYGMLSEVEANDDVLMAQSSSSDVPAVDSGDGPVSDEDAAQLLAEVAGIPPNEALAVVEEVQDQVEQAPPGGASD